MLLLLLLLCAMSCSLKRTLAYSPASTVNNHPPAPLSTTTPNLSIYYSIQFLEVGQRSTTLCAASAVAAAAAAASSDLPTSGSGEQRSSSHTSAVFVLYTPLSVCTEPCVCACAVASGDTGAVDDGAVLAMVTTSSYRQRQHGCSRRSSRSTARLVRSIMIIIIIIVIVYLAVCCPLLDTCWRSAALWLAFDATTIDDNACGRPVSPPAARAGYRGGCVGNSIEYASRRGAPSRASSYGGVPECLGDDTPTHTPTHTHTEHTFSMVVSSTPARCRSVPSWWCLNDVPPSVP